MPSVQSSTSSPEHPRGCVVQHQPPESGRWKKWLQPSPQPGRQEAGTAAGEHLRALLPCAPITPTLSIGSETSLGQGRGDAWWSLLPGRLERAGVMPGLGWTLLKEPPKAFQNCPCSEKSASEWDLLQRQLPVFRHSTCSSAVSCAQLQLFHPLMTHPHKTIHSDTNWKRAVSKDGQTGPFSILLNAPSCCLHPAAPGVWDAVFSHQSHFLCDKHAK